jgi:cytochrome bd-type quinol oxidase subunit 1
MSVPERRAMVERPGESLSVRRQCALLNLARSGVYRPGPVTGADDLALMRGSTNCSLPHGESDGIVPQPAAFAASRRLAFWTCVAGCGASPPEAQTAVVPANRRSIASTFSMSVAIMVGCGLIMLALAWLGSYLSVRHRLERNRLVLWSIFLSFPLPFIAILTGWYTAEVGRQPWVVYGLLRTADAMTPFLTAPAAITSLILFGEVYVFIFSFGTYYIYRLLRAGPSRALVEPSYDAVPNRPMSVADQKPVAVQRYVGAGE